MVRTWNRTSICILFIKITVMKKTRILITLALVAFCAIFLFTECERDYSCTMKVVCRVFDGVDTGKVAANAHVVVGKEEYAEHARAEGYTNDKGIFLHVFPYPALLDVTVTYYDTVHNASGGVDSVLFTGAGQVQLYESETTEKLILLMETQR